MARKRTKTAVQLELKRRSRTWGGWREGAGRPAKEGSENKGRRQRFSRATVCHVTIKVRRELPSLRRRDVARRVATALWIGARNDGFRLVHFSIQGNHVHLIVEASCWRALSKGMHALKIRVARAINAALQREGSVFCERYHARLLQTPTEIRNALRYALNNRRRHIAYRLDPAWVDPLSTARWFDGYRDRDPDDNNPMPRARTFLLATGWRRGRGGCFRSCDVPGSG